MTHKGELNLGSIPWKVIGILFSKELSDVGLLLSGRGGESGAFLSLLKGI